MSSDSGSGTLSAVLSPQLPRAVLRGDPLDHLLGAGAERPASAPEPASSMIRAAVIGIDGRHLRTRELRQRLRAERHDFAHAVARLPGVRHMIIVLRVERDAERVATRVLDRMAHLAHIELEMRRSRDICVTGVVIADDGNAGTLIEHLNERIRHTPIEGSYVVSARQLVERDISATAAEELL
ncbi:hypothetical protein [Microbacterium sp. LWO12-1.2]|uniref:hypothetical protein n=1 Tax=Microbacterium sp. LWO12-1.2 TaxID=3135261 RepID=UPI00344069B2